MSRLTHVTYCGLYCKLCAQCGRIPAQAQALRDAMDQEGYPFWAGNIPDFAEFWRFLTGLADQGHDYQGCRSGDCGYTLCEIRQCALKREIVVCPLCALYPCERIEDLAQRYPTLIADGRRMQVVGLDTWIQEQEQRARAGFCYADSRYNTR
jgi:hypothetical protein